MPAYTRAIYPTKRLGRRLSDALLARRKSLDAKLIWATAAPYHCPRLRVDHLRVEPAVYCAADNEHPALVSVREALTAALEPASPTLAALGAYRAEQPHGTITHDPYGNPAHETIDAAADRDQVSLREPFTRFLYQLVRAIRPHRVLELGTAHGVGSLHLLAALHRGRRSRAAADE